MKFSYSLIEKFVKPKSKDELVNTLRMKAFDCDVLTGDTFDAEIPHNRYADAASHIGVAREYAAAVKKDIKEPAVKDPFEKKSDIKVTIKNEKLCARYSAVEYELGKKGTTPAWMKKALESCGLRPIHPVVDILNYVMLEVGQPLHAFDADKLHGGIIVRNAKDREKITTIDGQKFTLNKDILVIADEKQAHAIAGIKGGKVSEVGAKTKRIIIEAANFDGPFTYKAQRKLDLITDASNRFAHGISPHLTELGQARTRVLLEEILDANYIGAVDVYPKPQNKAIIGFSIKKANKLIGMEFGKNEIVNHLTRLGFKISPAKNKSDDFLVEVPPLRTDVTIFEDVVEEVVRLYGLDNLVSVPPTISMSRAKEEDVVILKDKMRQILVGAGYTEVYNYSFGNEYTDMSYELEKPIAENKKYMRYELIAGLKTNLDSNSRFFEEVRIFEIGNVFDKEKGERLMLGMAMKSSEKDAFLDLKGTAEKLVHRIGIVDFLVRPSGVDLEIKVGEDIVGVMGISGKDTATAEFDITKLLELVVGEYEYREISKYPSIMRDISLEIMDDLRVGDILNEIENAGAEHVLDVDLIDYYDPQKFTFRIIFQSNKRTLKDKEVSGEMAKIEKHLKSKFRLEIR